jgi:hypothetical protein
MPRAEDAFAPGPSERAVCGEVCAGHEQGERSRAGCLAQPGRSTAWPSGQEMVRPTGSIAATALRADPKSGPSRARRRGSGCKEARRALR